LPIVAAARDRWVRHNRAKGGAVGETDKSSASTCLVHCQKGISRSAAVVAGYLIEENGWTSEQSIEYLQKLRPQVDPNIGFRDQLRVFEHQRVKLDGLQREEKRQRLLLLLRNVSEREDSEIRSVLGVSEHMMRIERKGSLTCLWFACRATRRRTQQTIIESAALREKLSGNSECPAQLVSFGS